MIFQLLTTVLVFLTLLGVMEFGRWLRRRRDESTDDNSAVVDAVVFAVLGLMIAFTFNSSASRFDERRELIVEQSNALRTAWLRTELLPEPDREPIRRCMREWVALVLESMHLLNDNPAEWDVQLVKIQNLHREAWRLAVLAVDRNTKPQYAALVLAPMNDWIALSAKRLEMNNRGLPGMVFPSLLVLSLAGAILAGYSLGKHPTRSPLHMLLFAGVITMLLFIISDMNQPRSGLIRTDSTDAALLNLYRTMTSDAPTTQSDRP